MASSAAVTIALLRPHLSRQRAEDDSPRDGANAVENSDEADGLRRELHLHSEESRINVLRSMGEAHEGCHEDDEEKERGHEVEQFPRPCGSRHEASGPFACGLRRAKRAIRVREPEHKTRATRVWPRG